MTEKAIIDAYCIIRKTNNTIPDDVLDFMKDSAIEKLRSLNPVPKIPDVIQVRICRGTNSSGYKPFYVKTQDGSPYQIKDAYRDFSTLAELKESFQVQSIKQDGQGWEFNSSGSKSVWTEYLAEIPSTFIL